MSRIGIVIILTTMALAAPAAYAQRNGADENNAATDEGTIATPINYDHAGTNKSVSYERSLRDGEALTVTIANTCPDSFDYGVTAIQRSSEDQEGREASEIASCEAGTKTVNIVHERQNGGYIIDVKRKPDAVTRLENGTELNDVQIVIHVITEKWEAEMAGGFSITGLTDPRFGLVTKKVSTTDPDTGETTETDQNFVVRDRAAEDDTRLGVGAFLHVYHTKLPWLAGTFGLGVNEANRTTYFTGLTWRWGDAGAITGGYAWGSVDRLPAGTRFDEPVQANLLSNLGSRTDGNWFVAYSYKFLGSRDFFEKPLKPVAAGNAATTGTTQTPAAGAAPGTTPGAATGSPILPPPESLEAKGECQKVSLTWKAVEGANSYKIYRTSKEDCSGLVEVGRSNEPKFENKDLAANKKFFYAVRAFNGVDGDRTSCKSAETTCNEDP